MKRLGYIFPLGVLSVLLLFSVEMRAQCGGFSATISTDPPPPWNLCPGETITLTANVSGGTAPYTYDWFVVGQGLLHTPSISLAPPYQGGIDLYVYDANGCDVYVHQHVKAWTWTVDVVSNPAPVCQGDSLLLNAWPDFPAGTTFQWSTGQTTQNIYVYNSGTYSITVTEPSGDCTATESHTVTFSPDPAPNPTLVGPASLCAGQSATLTVDGGPFYIYYWNNFTTDPTLDISAPGLYWVSVANDALCWTTDSLVVESGAAAPALTGPTGLCSGQSGTIAISNAASFTDFDWSNGASTPSITVSNPGTYTVTVSAGGSCTSTGSFTVTSNGSNISLSGTTSPVTSCVNPDGNVNLSVSPSGVYTFNWSSGATTEDLADVAAGSYTVTATDAGGCSASASFTVTTNTTTPFILTNVTPATCGQSNGAIDLNVTPPAGTFSYQWSNGATTQDLSNLVPGDYWVTVTFASNGCTSTASASVGNTSTTLNVTGTVIQPFGGQNNGSIDTSVSPSGTYTYLWSNGATTEDLDNLAPGTYTVTVSAGANCTATASFSLSLNCAITLEFNSYYNFCDPTTTFLEVIPSGGNPPYTYLWETGATTQTITVPNAPDQYFVTVTDAAGCVEIDWEHVKPQAPGPYYPYNNEGCEGNTVTLFMNWIRDSFPGTTYLWNTGATTPSINITTSGNYNVTITSPDGCTFVSPVDFTFHPTPMPEIIGPTTLCPGNSATLSLTGGNFSSIFWLPQGLYQPTVDVTEPGTYVAYAWLDNITFCPGADTITILPGNIPPPNLNGPPALCTGQSGIITVSNLNEYTAFLWSNGATTPSISVSAPGNYQVTVTNAGGCTATGSFDVTNDPNAPSASTDPTPATCGENNGSVDLTVSPPGAYTYLWSNGSGSEDLSNLPTGTYSVTVTSGGGCTATSSVVVPENTVNITLLGNASPNTSCIVNTGGVDLTVSPSGTYTFDWSNGATTEDLLNVAPGNYAVTVSTGLTCTSSAVFTVDDEPILPILAVDPNPATCDQNDGTINLTATGSNAPFFFDWSTGSSSEDLADLSPGSYSVTVTGSNGCTLTEQATVTSISIPVNVAGVAIPNTDCGGGNGSIDITPSPTGTYNFVWSNGASTEDLANLPPGTYSVTATLGGGCLGSASFTVADNGSAATLSGSVQASNSCAQPNGAVDLIISPSGIYNVLWSNGATSEDLQNVASGSYVVTVSAGGNCTSTAVFEVPNNAGAPNAAAAPAAAICSQNNGSIDLTISPSGNYAFVWSNSETSEDLQNVGAGSYSVTVSAANGCSTVASAVVANNLVNFSLAGAVQGNTSCASANGAVDLTVSPLGIYEVIWSNGTTSQDLQNVASGSYSVTVSAGGNCISTASFVVPNNAGAPNAAVAPAAAICGQNNGAVDLTISPSGSYDYLWSNGASSEDLQNVGAGSYLVTVSAANGCSAVASATVADSTLSFTASAVVLPNSSCTAANGSIDLNVSAPGNFNYLWSNGATSQDLQNLPAGDYSVTVSQAGTCSTTATYSVSGGASAPIFSQNISPAECGAAVGGIDLTITPAVGNNFIWSTGATSEDLQNLPPGNYAVTVTTSNGCSATGTIDVPNQSDNFTLTGSPTPSTTCSGGGGNGSIELTLDPPTPASGSNYSFVWSNGATSQNLIALPAGPYTVTVSDGTSCTSSAIYEIISNAPTLNLAGVATPVACFGGDDGSIHLTPDGGSAPYVFNWSPALPGNPHNPVQLAAGSYSVTTTDANGCSATANFTVGQPASGVAIACQTTANASAPGASDGAGSVSMQGGTAPYFISWTPGNGVNQPVSGSNFNLSNLTEGNYSVTVTDANGCPENCTFTISSGAQPCVAAVGTMQTATLTACGNDCISANYSAAGQILENGDLLQFVLHQGNANQIVNEIARNAEPVFCFDASQMMFGTTYFVSAVVGDGDAASNVILTDPCTAVSLGTPVIFYEKPVASAAGENINCQQTTANLTGTSSLSGSQFQWTTQNGTFGSFTIIPNTTATSAGIYTLFVSKLGCADTAEVQVLDLRNHPVAMIDSDSDNTLNCSVDAVSLTGSYAGSTDGAMFWFSNGNLLGTLSLLTVQEAGTYQFVILDTVTFCGDTAEMQILENHDHPPVFVNTPPVLNCLQTSVTLTGGSTVGGIEFAWASIAAGGDTTILGTGTSLSVSAPGTYFLIATDPENGCENAASQAVFANTDAPQADAGENQTLDCHETPVTLTGSGFPDNVSFAWSSPGVQISAPNSVSILVSEAGIYTLVVQRPDNFCMDTATVQVFDYQTTAQAQVTVEPPTCNGDGNGSILVETDPANVPYQFILDGTSYGSNPHLTPLSAGTYLLQVADNQGCTWTAEVVVPDPPVLQIDLGADLFVEFGQTVTLTAQVTVPPSALEAVLWQPDSLFDCPVGICLEQEITPLEQTSVLLTVIDTFGCKATDRLLLFVRKDVDVYIPNTFSPNGDGVNDTFTIFGDPSQIEEVVEFQVFQRWGEFVYKYEHFPPNDPFYGWDGNFNGTPLDPQVFVYWVVVKFTDGTEGFFEGGITLLR